jgi:hypothetical protein
VLCLCPDPVRPRAACLDPGGARVSRQPGGGQAGVPDSTPPRTTPPPYPESPQQHRLRDTDRWTRETES